MNLKDFYPEEIKPSYESHNENQLGGDVFASVEEIEETAEEKLAAASVALDDLEKAEKSIEQMDKVAGVATTAIKNGETDEATLAVINAAFESVAASIDYPVTLTVSSEDLTDTSLAAESVTERAKEFGKNVWEAIKRAIAAVADAVTKAIAWVKRKVGIYKKAFDSLEKEYKEFGKPKEEKVTVSVPGPVQVYATIAGADITGGKLAFSTYTKYFDDVSTSYEKVADTLKGMKPGDAKEAVKAVKDGKTTPAPVEGLLAAATDGSPISKHEVEGAKPFAVRARGIYTVSADKGVAMVSASDLKDFKDVFKAATTDGKVEAATPEVGDVLKVLSVGKDALAFYEKNVDDVYKALKEASKSAKELSKAAKEEDEDTKKAVKVMVADIRAFLRAAPAVMYQGLDLTNTSIKVAKTFKAAYEKGDGKKEEKKEGEEK